MTYKGSWEQDQSEKDSSLFLIYQKTYGRQGTGDRCVELIVQAETAHDAENRLIDRIQETDKEGEFERVKMVLALKSK